MSKRLGFDDFADSQYAIKEYLEYREENIYPHDARVVISSDGKMKVNDIMRVIAVIETNNSCVEIIGNEAFERDYYIRYTNEYQKFKFIKGTLLIQGEDRCGNSIEIDITGV